VPPEPGNNGAKATPGKAIQVSPTFDTFELRVVAHNVYVDEVHWTRNYVVASLANANNTDVVEARLMEAELAISQSLETFIGTAHAANLDQLLMAHVTGLHAILAAQGGDAVTVARTRAAWFDNADQIASALAAANPSWNVSDLQGALHAELTQTLAQIDARVAMEWSDDSAAYDATRDAANALADLTAHGLVIGFPKRVTPTTVSSGEQTLRLSMQVPLEDTALWTQQLITSHNLQLGDETFAFNRLSRTTSDLGTVLAPTFGAAAITHIVTAMQVVIDDTRAYLVEKDPDARNMIRGVWFGDGQEAANAFYEGDPSLSLADLGKQMGIRVASTSALVDASTARDSSVSIEHYDVTVLAERNLATVVGVAAARPIVVR
jgi:hypothetical protein